MTNDLLNTDATQQAAAIKSKQVSPTELVAMAIAAIEKVNPIINSVIHTRFEKAMEEAKTADISTPFGGVPMVVKDLECPIAGEPHHMGARFLKHIDYRAPIDSYLTKRFRKAGFVFLGRTNTPEFGGTITTEPLAYGPTLNPWNIKHSTGGSSGGSAATVAARCVALAHGNDGGGSIRIPASECGLVGLKPSRGRVSKGPEIGEAWMGSTIDGVLTRTVRDTAFALDLISGYECGDPYCAPPFARPLTMELGTDPGKLRIGILDRPLLATGVDDPESRESVAKTAKLLESLGHHVEIAHPQPIGEQIFADLFTMIVAAANSAAISMWEKQLGRKLADKDLEPDTALMSEIGRSISASDHLQTVDALHAWSRRVIDWWLPRDSTNGFDLLVTPVIAGPPPQIGWLSGPDGMSNLLKILQYTAQFNVTGQPAISIPMHWSKSGLPMGVQLVAAPFREDVLIQVGWQLESISNWSQHRPTIHA